MMMMRISTPKGADPVIFTSPNQEPSPSKRVGSFFELVQIPGGGGRARLAAIPPLGRGLWSLKGACWFRLMHGWYGRDAGPGGGRLRGVLDKSKISRGGSFF